MLPKRIYAEVDLDAIASNVAEAKKKTGRRTLAVIKADGYGHGALQIARRLTRDGLVWGFGVATSGEALALRRGGITHPILILGYVFPEDYDALIRADVRLAVLDLDSARDINEAASGLGLTAKVHIALDTGMGRIGFRAEDDSSAAAIIEIMGLPNLALEGIFTHFACADTRDKSMMHKQQARFSALLSRLDTDGIMLHCANSAAIMELESGSLCYYDMVRCGVMTYGLLPSDEVELSLPLRPAMRLVSHVAYVKTIEAGDTVSYGATYTACERRIIATIPVGYADGYPRALSNCGRVIVRGVSLPIVGRICMDQFMVDATALPDIRRGDEVVLLGSGITADELASLCKTINYELVCGISKRVPRVYINGGEVTEISDLLVEN